MPAKKKNRAFSELSKSEKLARARKAKQKASSKLKGPTRSNKRSERVGAERALKAASRVEARLTGGKVDVRTSKSKPSKMRLRQGVEGLMDLARKARTLPGKVKGNLEHIEQASASGKK